MISNISFTYRSIYSKKAMTDMDSTNLYAYISIITLFFCLPPTLIVEGPQLLKHGFADAIANVGLVKFISDLVWAGLFYHLYNQVVRKPAHHILSELGIDYDEKDDYVVIKHAAMFTSTIMSKLLARPNVKLFNDVADEDLIIKGGRVGSVVTNWSLVSQNHDTQSCMDPNVMEAKVVDCLSPL